MIEALSNDKLSDSRLEPSSTSRQLGAQPPRDAPQCPDSRLTGAAIGWARYALLPLLFSNEKRNAPVEPSAEKAVVAVRVIDGPEHRLDQGQAP